MKSARLIPQDNSSETCACPVCGSLLVYPLERIRVGGCKWRLLMNCPECFSWHVMCVSQEEVTAVLKQVREGRDEMGRILAEAERHHMAEECEKFIGALRSGNIQPIDF